MNNQPTGHLVERFVRNLGHGIGLIENLTDEQYVFSRPTDRGTVGTHFRHILDFISRFVDGVRDGRIDYNKRERDPVVESSRAQAVAQFQDVIRQLRTLPADFGDQRIETHLEPGNFVDEESAWCVSSVLRELEFLQSHTLHHYALIAAKLSLQGIETGENFGVAPSTLDHWKHKKKSERKALAG